MLRPRTRRARRTPQALELRATVAAEYGISDNPWESHRAAWDEALPTLREAWAAHESQYPYPERSRATPEPDGSWHSGDLELAPKRNAEVEHACERIREIGERDVIPGVRAVEADDAGRSLAGFEHRFKGADRIKEKVAYELRDSPDLATPGLLSMVQDAVRFTFQYDESSYSTGVRKGHQQPMERARIRADL